LRASATQEDLKTVKSRWSLSLGRILGFPVDVHISLIAMLALLLAFGGRGFGIAGLILAGLTFASVLLHELGHSVIARRRGVPILGISLYPFGGVAKMAGMPRGPRDEIAIAIAGPIVSIALAVGFYGLAQLGDPATGTAAALGYLSRINAMLGVFNLLPALPMDGGRVFRAWLALRRPFLDATLKATRLSRALAWGMIVLAMFTNLWLAFIGTFVLLAASREERLARSGAARYGMSVDPAQGPIVQEDPWGNVTVTMPPRPRG
jgi:Zn-dependent protease